jgi:heme oxygenase (biliverdin-IX-beta and delta-forming)
MAGRLRTGLVATKYGLAVAKKNPASRQSGRWCDKSVSGLRQSRRAVAALDLRPAVRLTAGVSGANDRCSPAVIGRQLLRRCDRAALGTSLRGAPFVSLVLCAVDLDASPLLLVSDLARHSRNIAFDPRVSLLFDGTAKHPEPLSGPRLTLLGRVEAAGESRLLARFAARHPSSRNYAGFSDFKVCRVVVERGHLVAGFGRIGWIEGGELLFGGDSAAFAAAEAAIVAQINKTLHETLARCVVRHLGCDGAGWRVTACDPEGLDIRCGGTNARLDFAAPVATAAAVPAALAELAERAAAAAK